MELSTEKESRVGKRLYRLVFLADLVEKAMSFEFRLH
jgi:hypothetical protein